MNTGNDVGRSPVARSSRRLLAAASMALLVGAGLVAAASPANAQAPFPPGTQASAIVGGAIVAACPPPVAGAVDGGTDAAGVVTVFGPAGAQCALLGARAGGNYTVNGVGGQFDATCENTGGSTGGFVTVPAGTRINDGAPVAGPTPINTTATVVFPDGSTAIVNEVIVTPTSVTRNAIRFTGGPAAGIIVGQVICGAFAYPLAVDAGGASAGPASISTSSSSGSDNTGLTVAAAAALVLAAMAHVALGRRARRGQSAA